MGQEDRHLAGAQCGTQLFDLGSGVAEDKTLFAAMQGCDEFRRVVEGPNVVQFDLARRTGNLFGGGLPIAAHRLERRQRHPWSDDAPCAGLHARALQPVQQLIRIADGRGQTDALDGPPGDLFEPFQYGQQVPAPVVAGKSVHFIDNHGPYAPQQACVVGLDADQHRLERLGRGQQDIGGLGSNALPLRLLGVAVPEGGTSSQPLGVRVDAADEVVEKCFERAEVEHRGAGPLLFCHGRQQGKQAASVLPPAVGASSTASSPSMSGVIAARWSGRRSDQPRVLTMWCRTTGSSLSSTSAPSVSGELSASAITAPVRCRRRIPNRR